MFRGYRGIWVTLAALAIVAATLFFLIRDLSTVDSAYSHASADAAVEYQRDASTYIEKRCFTPAGLREPDCTSKADEAAREGQRKEQDLAAQNITAWWTKIMGIAALIGMALSAVGVWLVKTTFDETRKANEIAENTAERHLRPYVFVTEAMLVETENDGAAINISFKNFGATPAYGVTIQSGIAIVRLPVESSPIVDTDVSCARVIAPSQQIETSANVEGVKAFRAALQQNGCIILHTKITYEISPGITDSDEETVIADLDDIANGRFRFPREGEILNP